MSSYTPQTDRQIDEEWESGDGFRTVYRPSDDDYCEICDGEIVDDHCGCDR